MANVNQSSGALLPLKITLFCIIYGLFPVKGWGQLAKEHKFPPLYSGNNEGEVGYLYISTPETTPFPVTISYHHQYAYWILTPPGQWVYYDKYIDTTIMVSNSNPIEYYAAYANLNMTIKNNTELNTILPERGFILKGPKEFYASYRIHSANQAGCITSKGDAAKGTKFSIGHLVADFGNHTVGMMATEDNTLVTISNFRPNTYLMSSTGSFLATAPISFTLNAGESYVIAMDDGYYQGNFTHGLFGLLVESTKPIVVDCGSWLGSPVDGNDNTWDIGIDQAVPLENVGTEYILMAGDGPYSIESGLVVGHFDSTKVFVNGSTNPIILNAGQYLNLNKNNYYDNQGNWKGNMYIKTDKKVFVYQSLGNDNDERTASLNVIPPTNCQTGNFVNNIPFVDKIGSEDFTGEVHVVASSNANVVEIRKNGQLVPLGTPVSVQGNPDYVIYRTDLDGTISVFSDGPIQVSISGRSGKSGQGGYYSDFKKTFVPEVALQPNAQCLDTLFLQKKYINGGVTWYLNDQVLSQQPQVDSVLAIAQPGEYMAIGKYITFCGEEVFDTAYYTVPDNFFSVTMDITPLNCSAAQQEGQITVQVTGNGTYQYSLNNGAFGSNPTFNVSAAGQYMVQVQDQQGCTKTLSVNIEENLPTMLTATLCPGDSIKVNGTVYNHANPSGTEYISGPDCDTIIIVSLNTLSQAIGYINATLCKGESLVVGSVTFDESNPAGSVTLPNASIFGCDSIFEVQLDFLPKIETYIETFSCNPADTGVVVQVLQSYQGCDSIVVTTTTFKETVFVEQSATTCDPAAVGQFTEYIGCDSVITTNVSLDISGILVQYDTVFTCIASEVGEDTIFVNSQNWCNGAIFRTTLPTQTVFIEKEILVCRLSEVRRDTFYFGCDSVVYVNKLYDLAGVAQSNRSEWVCQSSEVGIDTLWLLTHAGCDSLDIVAYEQAPTDSTTLQQKTCNPDNEGTSVAVLQNQYGCDSTVTTITTFEPSSIPMTQLTRYTCHLDEVGEVTFTYKTPEGCDSLVIVTTYYDASLVPVLDADAIDESCYQKKDGRISLDVVGGTPPFLYSINGDGPFQNNVFADLPPGNYQLLVIDSLGCADSTEVTILEAQELTAILSPATLMVRTCNDTARLAPEINPGHIIDSIRWSPSNWLDCTDCLTPLVMAPKSDITYELRVYHNGCSVIATQNIKVKPCGNCYVPNAIHPESNGENSKLTIFCDENITNIKWLRIYDRWGELMFEKNDIVPNDPSVGWDGTHLKKKKNKQWPRGPEVFVWYAEIEYTNGYVEILKGDVTVVR